MGRRKYFFIASGVLVALSVVALLVRGLTFGIDFQGGTTMTIVGAEGVTTEDVRAALEQAGVPDTANATIQPTDDGGFIVRTAESDTGAANDAFNAVVASLDLPEQDANVTTIGPGWGSNVTEASLVALAVSLVAILVYISIRFEYKMSLVAVLALVHDVTIVLGIYAISGREVTPNTIAALLTILGYSLYDTIVVFHRIRENAAGLTKMSFMAMTAFPAASFTAASTRPRRGKSVRTAPLEGHRRVAADDQPLPGELPGADFREVGLVEERELQLS